MTIKMLPLNFLTAFILTINNFIKTSFVMRLEVLVDYNRIAFLVTTLDFPIDASNLMRVHLFSFKSNWATLFKKAVPLIRAINYFIGTLMLNMVQHVSSFNLTMTVILALKNCFGTVICNMILHVIKLKHKSTLKKAFDYSIRAFMSPMLFNIFPEDQSTSILIVIWTIY